jgi:hypothetical protein
MDTRLGASLLHSTQATSGRTAEIIRIATVVQSFVRAVEWVATGICPSQLLEPFDCLLDFPKLLLVLLLIQ